MLNIYSCGCTDNDDVISLARCDEHGAYLVSTIRDKIKKVQSFRADNMRIRHQALSDTLKLINEKRIKFDLICSYPDHDQLHAYNQMETGWHKTINPMFSELYKTLSDDGHMLLVVEQSVFARLVYDCTMSGFHVNSVTVVSSTVPFESYQANWMEFYVYKFAVLFSKNGSVRRLPEYMKLKDVPAKLSRKFKPLRVLDLSCRYEPFLYVADNTVGVCENYNLYKNLKRKLCP